MFRHQYVDRENDAYLSDLTAIDCSAEPDKTLQQFKEEVDLNTMIRRFGVTGQPPTASSRTPFYGDFSNVPDYQTALNAVRAAEDGFAALPAAVRERFGNNPGALLDFIGDDANYDEAVKLGLIPAKPVSDPIVKVEDLPAQ